MKMKAGQAMLMMRKNFGAATIIITLTVINGKEKMTLTVIHITLKTGGQPVIF